MAEQVDVKIITVDAVNNLADLKKAIKDAKDNLATMNLGSKEYQKQLKEFGQERTRILQRRAVAERRMEQLRVSARKALPPGATDAQVEAELDANPTKYLAWRELVSAWKASVAEEERLNAAIQAAVARRISRKETGNRAQGAVPEVK